MSKNELKANWSFFPPQTSAALADHDFHKANGGDHRFFTEGPSLTRQEFVEECDINTLMARYDGHVHGGPGGLVPVGEPMYVDWSSMPQTLLEYMTFMQEAEASFMSLPAAVRKEFDNDPVAFVDFASDPENLPQMRDWGLAAPAKPPAEVPQAANASPPPGGTPAPAAASASPGGAPTHGST